MGLFDFFAKDPTTYWSKSSKQKLKLDLNDFSINKLKLGAPKGEISRFGKPDNKKAYKKDNFRYFESGLEIDTENNAVNYFAIVLEKDQFSGDFKGADFTIITNSYEEVKVTKETNRSELINLLGIEVTETDKDDEEIVDFLKTDTYTIELESSGDGKLFRFNLYIND